MDMTVFHKTLVAKTLLDATSSLLTTDLDDEEREFGICNKTREDLP